MTLGSENIHTSPRSGSRSSIELGTQGGENRPVPVGPVGQWLKPQPTKAGISR